MKLKIILTLLAVIAVINVHATCLNLNTKFTYRGKVINSKEALCFKDKYPMSKKCFDGKCQALLHPPKNALKKVYSKFGNPLFKVCRHYGGLPQIYHYLHEKKWVKTSRCLFKADESFIDNSFLFKLNNSSIVKSPSLNELKNLDDSK